MLCCRAAKCTQRKAQGTFFLIHELTNLASHQISTQLNNYRTFCNFLLRQGSQNIGGISFGTILFIYLAQFKRTVPRTSKLSLHNTVAQNYVRLLFFFFYLKYFTQVYVGKQEFELNVTWSTNNEYKECQKPWSHWIFLLLWSLQDNQKTRYCTAFPSKSNTTKYWIIQFPRLLSVK